MSNCASANMQGLAHAMPCSCPTGGMGGRIDHTLSNLNTLLSHRRLNIVLLGDNSTARLLPAGEICAHLV